MNEAGANNRAVPEKRHLPGEEGVWVFIGGDMLVFAVFFVAFLFARMENLPLFETSQATLDRGLGLLNTVLLLTSSWCVARAVKLARAGRAGGRRMVLGAMGLGLGFVVVKAVEYTAKVSAGYTLNTNEFFIYYFMFTGIHLLHVLIGLGVLAYTASRFGKDGLPSNGMGLLEGTGAFWHLVDLLWIVLFALFYLI